jgi:hypothetical protein
MHYTALANLGLTISELTVIRTAALAAITAGNKVVTSIGVPGLNTSFAIQDGNPIELLKASTYALQFLTGSFGSPMNNEYYLYGR